MGCVATRFDLALGPAEPEPMGKAKDLNWVPISRTPAGPEWNTRLKADRRREGSQKLHHEDWFTQMMAQ